MLKLIPLTALITSAVMLWLAVVSVRDDLKKPRASLRQSWDVMALSIGFVCMFLTALYALAGIAIANLACL